jgi:hypothetical protein
MFYVVQSIPSYSNPQHVLSAHTTLAEAQTEARAQAQRFCNEQVAQYKAANAVVPSYYTVAQHSAAQLDAVCLTTFAVADDCWNVTGDIAAYMHSAFNCDLL